jgi:hypothetical protein
MWHVRKRLTAPELWVAGEGVFDGADFYAVELSCSRSFQRQRRCRDRSPVAVDPRVVVGHFGNESASWQRGNRNSDRGSAGDG